MASFSLLLKKYLYNYITHLPIYGTTQWGFLTVLQHYTSPVIHVWFEICFTVVQYVKGQYIVI